MLSMLTLMSIELMLLRNLDFTYTIDEFALAKAYKTATGNKLSCIISDNECSMAVYRHVY